jgi:signal peptidase II
MKIYASRYGILGLAGFLLDRITKLWAFHYCVKPYVFTSWCYSEAVLNQGIAWSIGASSPSIILTGITIAISLLTCFMGIYVLTQHEQILPGAIMLIMTGALGNVFDRWVYGGVIDFIAVHYRVWHFPIFNIADVMICCGTFWWLMQGIARE